MISSRSVVTNRMTVKTLLLSAVLSLAACGGGGGNSNNPTPTAIPTLPPTAEPDTTPNEISITLPQTTFEPGAAATSEAVTITGIDTLTTIVISGGGEYSIDGGSFTSAPGQIEEGQTLVVRTTASTDFGQTVSVTLTVGTESTDINIVTEGQDTTPDTFTFAAVTDLALASDTVSASATISGINDDTPVTIAGGAYSIDSGNYTSEPGSITSGQSITVRLTASTEFATPATATLTVGGVDAVFSVTTVAQDVTPDTVSLINAIDAAMGALSESAPVTISGITGNVGISVAGGEYSIAGGDFTRDAGTITNGQEIVVRGMAPATASASQDVVLTVGTETSTYSIFTPVDNTAPVAELYFPTQVGLTDQAELQVRGIASDDISSITAITVNGIDVTSTDDFATWQATVPLALGDTEISVVTTDSVGNTGDPQLLSTITRRDDLTGAFPLDSYDVTQLFALKFIDNYQTLVVAERLRKIYKMNPQTGELTVFSNGADPLNDTRTLNSWVFRLAYFDNLPEPRLFCLGEDVFEINIETGERTLFAETAFNDPEVDADVIQYVDEFKGGDAASSYMLAHNGDKVLFKVNVSDGSKTVVSDPADVDLGVGFGTGVAALSIAHSLGAVYASTGGTLDATLSVDLLTGFRTLISADNVPEGNLLISVYYDSEISGDESHMYITGAIDVGTVRPVLKMNLQAGDDYGRTTTVRSDVPPGQVSGKDMELWEERGLAYVNDTRSVAVVDVETGDAVILFRYAFP